MAETKVMRKMESKARLVERMIENTDNKQVLRIAGQMYDSWRLGRGRFWVYEKIIFQLGNEMVENRCKTFISINDVNSADKSTNFFQYKKSKIRCGGAKSKNTTFDMRRNSTCPIIVSNVGKSHEVSWWGASDIICCFQNSRWWKKTSFRYAPKFNLSGDREKE